MKRLIFIFLTLILSVFLTNGQTKYDSAQVKIFREARDRDFRNPQLSPLRPEDFSTFKGLDYFSIDENYSVKVVFTKTPDEKTFMMPTSSGRSARYLKIGVLNFDLNGKNFVLNAYRREYENSNFKINDDNLFVPFRDLTSGKESYGAGRYVYLKMPAEKEAILDFNLSFSPSCAYGNESFSCPIPPKENFLPIEIRAGEKIYK